MRFLVCALVILLCLKPLPSLSKENSQSVVFTPRIWFSWLSSPDEDDDSREVILVPVWGGTVSYVPPTSSFVLSLTALTGKGKGDFQAVQSTQLGTAKVTRKDIEGFLKLKYLLDYNDFIGEEKTRNDFWVGLGLRYVSLIEKSTAGSFSQKDSAQIGVVEIGSGFTARPSLYDKMFAHLLLIVGLSDSEFEDTDGFEKSRKNSVLGFDTSIGITHTFSKTVPLFNAHVSVTGRYRAFVTTEKNDFGFTQFSTFQGPEFSFSFIW